MSRLTSRRLGNLPQRGEFVSVAGGIESCLVETSRHPSKIDHVWIDVRAGAAGLIRVTLNTCSLNNRDAGFDSRVRLGSVVSPWSELPAAGMWPAEPLDYAVIEAANAIIYLEYDQPTLEALLLEKAHRAVGLEGWGEFYLQELPGLHQLHSRRGSSGMPKDFVGRDGAVQFYFAEPKQRELLLFKFSGQP